jgi:hypothetical protein
MSLLNLQTPFVAIKLKGGLGNQLFQFATVLTDAIQHGKAFLLKNPTGSRAYALNFLDIKPNTFYLPKIEGGDLKIRRVVCNRFAKKDFYEEQSFDFRPIPRLETNLKLDGYFQSYRYFDPISLELKSWILHKMDILKTTSQSDITIHVRLGDMARSQHFRNFHGVSSSEYFIKGLEFLNIERSRRITAITDDLDFFPFEHQKLLEQYPLINVESNSMMSDFKTLINSRNLVISNSTFGWWAGYLSAGKVVAPSKWFNDSGIDFSKDNFYPTGWNIC